MNRFVAEGIAAEATEGKKVVYCGRRVEGLELRDQIEHLCGEHLARVTKTNGREEITTVSGGRVIFAASPSRLRGHTADVVFIDYSADQGSLSQEWLENAVIATATGGSVIRA
ncbi:MAG: hypothetical protein QJR09_11940 [Micrococcus sp.]|nr:hypothetical protein [Micrococcus sp.]